MVDEYSRVWFGIMRMAQDCEVELLALRSASLSLRGEDRRVKQGVVGTIKFGCGRACLANGTG